MFHPAGSFRTVWNMLTAITVLYDLIVIPLYAFDLPQTVALTVFGWAIMLFWNVDLSYPSGPDFTMRAHL